MGASAVILFIIPTSPLAQPWPFVGGQLLSALIGITCAIQFNDTSISAAVAVGCSVLVMLLLRCLHPPAAATALAPVMASDNIAYLDYSFVMIPVAINVMLMLVIAIIVNRWLLGKDYPAALPSNEDSNRLQAWTDTNVQLFLSEQDIEQALGNMDSFIDMTSAEIAKLLGLVEMQTFQRLKGDLSCADIMIREVDTVEFATEVEDAWKIMVSKKIKSMPVLDRSRRVIGILSWSDFFKFINLSAYDGFQERLRHFIRRTTRVDTDKPEVVGHIMTSEVLALQEDEHIANLISLMSVKGLRQIPIVNDQQRFIGMVYQENLIAALYHEQLANYFNKNN
jgi:CBS domain-containing membrane protein